jgi:hypothetical protein
LLQTYFEFLGKRENPEFIPIIPLRADTLIAVSAWFCGSPQSEFRIFYQVIQMNKSLVLIAVIAAAAALSACGKKEEAPAPAPAPVAAPAPAVEAAPAAPAASEAAAPAAAASEEVKK